MVTASTWWTTWLDRDTPPTTHLHQCRFVFVDALLYGCQLLFHNVQLGLWHDGVMGVRDATLCGVH